MRRIIPTADIRGRVVGKKDGQIIAMAPIDGLVLIVGALEVCDYVHVHPSDLRFCASGWSSTNMNASSRSCVMNAHALQRGEQTIGN
jgi:hypothetical protein